MEVILKTKDGMELSASIIEANLAELKRLKSWKFDWSQLYSAEKSKVYKIVSQEIEGLMMIQWIEEDFFEMKNIEVAPSNFGSEGKYVNIAQLLISYACYLSFEFNRGHYVGYLSFVSKGELIDYYIEKYGAELVYRDRLIISPSNSIELIKQHLKINL